MKISYKIYPIESSRQMNFLLSFLLCPKCCIVSINEGGFFSKMFCVHCVFSLGCNYSNAKCQSITINLNCDEQCKAVWSHISWCLAFEKRRMKDKPVVCRAREQKRTFIFYFLQMRSIKHLLVIFFCFFFFFLNVQYFFSTRIESNDQKWTQNIHLENESNVNSYLKVIHQKQQ